MKAEIKTNGILRVVPENETEAYALEKWWEGLGSIGEGQSGINADFMSIHDYECEEPTP